MLSLQEVLFNRDASIILAMYFASASLALSILEMLFELLGGETEEVPLDARESAYWHWFMICMIG
jgi:hypothetical protein